MESVMAYIKTNSTERVTVLPGNMPAAMHLRSGVAGPTPYFICLSHKIAHIYIISKQLETCILWAYAGDSSHCV